MHRVTVAAGLLGLLNGVVVSLALRLLPAGPTDGVGWFAYAPLVEDGELAITVTTSPRLGVLLVLPVVLALLGAGLGAVAARRGWVGGAGRTGPPT